MNTIATLKQQIKFALSQLSSTNSHHDFELMCFDIAKLRICSNILQATGPVSAGGDQGKDFETFKTYITNTPIANSTFFGLISDSNLVFACSLNKQVNTKIKADVKTIMEGNVPIKDIHYFSTENIPVAKRHELQEWAKKTYGILLQIYDLVAITDFLSDIEIFWIAQQYLNIPSEMYPRAPISDKDWYEKLLKDWKDRKSPPESFVDFSEIKMGIRHTTFNAHVKQDLPFWIKLFENFRSSTASEALKRSITYEIAVASLRGLGSMHGQEDRLRQYFSKIPELSASKDIEDASALSMYCVGAVANKAVNFSMNEVQTWRSSLIDRAEELVLVTKNAGYKCCLLEILGTLYLDPLRYKTKDEAIESAIKKWDELLLLVDNAPLFPLERFSDRMTDMIDIIGDYSGYHSFTRKIDQHLSKRYGGFIAAEKCRDRAVAFYKKGLLLSAIKELHQAKIDWFADETLKGSLIAMLLLSQWYSELGLTYAGKYYALAVAYIGAYSINDDVKSFVPRGLAQAAECDYAAGAWWNYLDLTELTLKGHGYFQKDPGDIEKHHELQHIIFYTTVVMYITSQLDKNLYEEIKKRVDQWGLTDLIDPLFEEAKESWSKMDLEKIWQTLEGQINGKPFNDLGEKRTVIWPALGITWKVTWENIFEKTAISEQFIAILQVLSADIADVDLCLLKSTVNVEIDLYDTLPEAHLEEEGKERLWKVLLPTYNKQEELKFEEINTHMLAAAVQIISDLSLLANDEITNVLVDHLKDGLSSKVFVANTYAKLYYEFHSEKDDVKRKEKNFSEAEKIFTVRSHHELDWISKPRKDYTKDKATEMLANRYKRGIVPIRLTLERLSSNKDFMDLVKKLRSEGWKDWHLITAIGHIVINSRINALQGDKPFDPNLMKNLFKELSQKEESKSDPVIPASVFTEEELRRAISLSQPSTLIIHDLHLKQRTLNIKAIDHFLRVRYNYWDEDIEHTSIL